jgi:cellulose biosynthesis protein BcsQ
MKTVAIYNNKGGVGKTTIAVHLALCAESAGLKTLAIGLDRQGDLMRWLGGGDLNISDGKVHDHSKKLSVLYSPDVFPKGLKGLDLVVVDCPPAIEIATRATADLFVVPVDGRLALQDLMNVLSPLCTAGQVLLVFNRVDAGGMTTLKALKTAAAKIPQQRLIVWEDIIPDSGAIKRSAEYFKAAWEVPYGEGSQGANALHKLCNGVLAHVQVTSSNVHVLPTAQTGRRGR